MNYSKAFTYVFEDSEWFTKILFAGLIGLIPVVGWLYLGGWTVEVIRRVRAGREVILPRTHFSAFVTLGFKYLVVTFVMAIPSLLITVFTSVSGNVMEQSENTVAALFSAGVSCVSSLLGVIVSVFVAMMVYVAIIRLAQTDKVGASLNFEYAFRAVKNNVKLLLVVYLIAIITNIISGLGAFLICLGMILTAPYAHAVFGHVLGQAANQLVVTPTPVRNSTPAHRDDVMEMVNTPAAQEAKEWVDPVLAESVPAEPREEQLPEFEQDESTSILSDAEEAEAEAEEEPPAKIADVIEDVTDSVEEVSEETKNETAENTDEEIPPFA